MDEGVDPTHMCQSLVHKVAQSKQLMAVADPAILLLFESWLEELEEEVLASMKQHPGSNAGDLAEKLGLSRSGAAFLIAKLEREGKL
jgi:DNA-binding MarR family transcriptional regulator